MDTTRTSEEENSSLSRSNELIDSYTTRSSISEEQLDQLVTAKVEEKLNGIGEYYETTTLLNTNIPANVSTNIYSLTLPAGIYTINSMVNYTFSSGIFAGGYNYFMTIDEVNFFWTDEEHPYCFRGAGTIVKKLTEETTIKTAIYSRTAFDINTATGKAGYMKAVRIK